MKKVYKRWSKNIQLLKGGGDLVKLSYLHWGLFAVLVATSLQDWQTEGLVDMVFDLTFTIGVEM